MAGFDVGNQIGINKRDLRDTPPLTLGILAEHDPFEHAITKVSEGVNAFGAATIVGSSGNQAIVPSSGTDVFSGVAAFSPEASDLDNLKYNDKDALGLQIRGVIVVDIEEAITDITSPVRVRHTNGRPGAFRTSAVAGESFLLTGAEWKTTGTIDTGVGKATLLLKGDFSDTADV